MRIVQKSCGFAKVRCSWRRCRLESIRRVLQSTNNPRPPSPNAKLHLVPFKAVAASVTVDGILTPSVMTLGWPVDNKIPNAQEIAARQDLDDEELELGGGIDPSYRRFC
ncbi:hypothetical protein J3459_011238 [Metarhizium acridum]|nr:hypothetical protein J3459_011238 [Metarhizium acridum]